MEGNILLTKETECLRVHEEHGENMEMKEFQFYQIEINYW